MDSRPVPLRAKVDRKSDKIAIVGLTFDKASAEACRRCQLCTAKPGPVEGQVVCSHEMSASAIPGFVWGSRVDRAMRSKCRQTMTSHLF